MGVEINVDKSTVKGFEGELEETRPTSRKTAVKMDGLFRKLFAATNYY